MVISNVGTVVHQRNLGIPKQRSGMCNTMPAQYVSVSCLYQALMPLSVSLACIYQSGDVSLTSGSLSMSSMYPIPARSFGSIHRKHRRTCHTAPRGKLSHLFSTCILRDRKGQNLTRPGLQIIIPDSQVDLKRKGFERSFAILFYCTELQPTESFGKDSRILSGLNCLEGKCRHKLNSICPLGVFSYRNCSLESRAPRFCCR